jgi:CRP-like cAMP-binding protein
VPDVLLLGEHGVPDDVIRQSTGHASLLTSPSFRKHASPCIDGVLNPDWPWRLAWDLMVMLLVLCDSVVLPFQLAEFGTDPDFDLFWLWLTVGAFLCDLAVNFCTGYRAGKSDDHLQEGTLVTEKVSIAINYLRGWSWIDFLSTVPWSVVVDAFQSNSETDASSAGQVTKLAKVIKLMRLLRLMRMLRLCKLAVVWERLEGRIGSITALNVIAMLRVVGVWTAICHWGACVWWMVGRRGSLAMLLTMQDDALEGLHWTEVPREHSRHDDFGEWRWIDKPPSEQYVFCFYWILGVMRTMPSEVTPVNLTERVFVLLFMFFAVAAFAINVTRITQAWFRFGARKDAFKEEMAYVRMHLRSIKCGTTLQLRAQAYLSHLFEKRKLHAKELGLLSALPEGLKRKLSQANKIYYLRMLPRLRDWIDPALRHVCDATEVVDYLPGDKLTEKDQPTTAAYVLMRGGLQVYAPSPQPHRRRSSTSANGALMRVSLQSELCFGRLKIVDEHCLFERAEDSLSRDTVVAMECSEVLSIDRQRFQEVLQKLQKLQDNQRRRRYEIERILRNEGDRNLGGQGQRSSQDSEKEASRYFGFTGKKLLQRSGTMGSMRRLSSWHFAAAGTMSAG